MKIFKNNWLILFWIFDHVFVFKVWVSKFLQKLGEAFGTPYFSYRNIFLGCKPPPPRRGLTGYNYQNCSLIVFDVRIHISNWIEEKGKHVNILQFLINIIWPMFHSNSLSSQGYFLKDGIVSSIKEMQEKYHLVLQSCDYLESWY